MNLKQRLLNFAITVDQMLLSAITLGSSSPDETISSAAYRLELKGAFWGRVWRPIIDWLLSPIEKDHCYLSYLAEKRRTQLPPELR